MLQLVNANASGPLQIGRIDHQPVSVEAGWRLYGLKQLEILSLLPLRDLRLVAGDLGLLDAQIVVDEIFAEAGGETGILAQRGERLLEAFRQMRCLDFVRRVRRRARVEP